jgi:uncharacterized protein YcaQ
MSDLSLSEARRIALAAQGFDRPRPSGPVTAQHFRRTVRQLGVLQIDFVNVLVPAHYLVPFSRLGAYDRSRFDEVVYRKREFTEQWAHEASIIPVETWPLLRYRMETHRVRPWGFEKFMRQHPEYVEGVLEEVRKRGPLAADELPKVDGIPGLRQLIPGAWSRSVEHATLEAHFGRGLLAVAKRRPDFSRVYELSERLIPAQHYACKVERAEAQRELLRLASRSHGIGTAADLAGYYQMPIKDAKPRIAELVEAGELRPVRIENWRETVYRHRDARLPTKIEAASLLSPFDPVVSNRVRVERLFDFDYRLEIFVPKGKRRWGYYVLPFLLGERLVARVDLKADRGERRLVVLAAYLEPHARPKAVAGALAFEMQTMARWLDLDSVAVARRDGFSRALAAAVK